MPIGSEDDDTYAYWKHVYDDIIKPAVEKGAPELTCFRVDEEFSVGTITSDIIEHLNNDVLCVVDVTDQNANVYYELGLRDSWHNRTIIITQDMKDVRFDKKDDRVFKYHKSDIKKIRVFEAKIAKCIKDILAEPDKVRNRVQEFLGQATTSSNQVHTIKRVIVGAHSIQLSQRVLNVLNVCYDVRFDESILPDGIIGFYSVDSNRDVRIAIVMPGLGEKQNISEYMVNFKATAQEMRKHSYASVQFVDSAPLAGTVNWSAIKRVTIIVPNEQRIADCERLLDNLKHHYSEVVPFNASTSLAAILSHNIGGGGWNFPLEDGSATIELWDSAKVAKLEEEYHLTA